MFSVTGNGKIPKTESGNPAGTTRTKLLHHNIDKPLKYICIGIHRNSTPKIKWDQNYEVSWNMVNEVTRQRNIDNGTKDFENHKGLDVASHNNGDKRKTIR